MAGASEAEAISVHGARQDRGAEHVVSYDFGISVVIPTRDRPALLKQTLAALLTGSRPPDEILVVDQGDPAPIRALLGQLASPLIRHLPSAEAGLSRARNLGVANAGQPVIAFLDDDCSPAPDWIETAGRLIAFHPDSRILISRVDHEREASGLRPLRRSLPRRETRRGRCNPWRRSPNGGASFFRSSVFQEVGGFDPALGQGSDYPGAEDGDMLYRILRSGLAITWADELRVRHMPWREVGDEAENSRRHGAGFGAWAAKNLAAGDAYPLLMVFGPQLISRALAVPFNRLRGRPERARRHACWLRGMLAGFIARMTESWRGRGRERADR